MTAGERILAWLGAGNTGTHRAIAQRLELPESTVIAAVKVLADAGLVEVSGTVERERCGTRGKLPRVWVVTDQPAPLRSEMSAEFLPLDRTPPIEIVRRAIANQHPLAAAWHNVQREAA